jgi:arylsulfatase A-like enzyme
MQVFSLPAVGRIGRWAISVMLPALIVAGWVFAGLVVTEGVAAEGDGKPNLLLIIGDDMGYADVGFHGCKDIPTPHLDSLAGDGVRFTQGYVSGPYCSPTRAGLLTGRYQTRFGHEFNPTGPNGLPTSQQTIADRLKGAGYVTGLVGKWHLGSQPELRPQRRGFDEFLGFLGGAHSFFEPQGIMRGDTEVTEMDYTTDAFGREASSFVERYRDRPWFLYLSFNAVHTPMHATDARLAKFAGIEDKQRRTYAAMMSAMDDAIGAVRAKLAETGQAEKTLIVFLSDNGGPTMQGVTVNGSRNEPLRGSKRTTLEGGIRVPMVVTWPGHLKPGVFSQPAIQLDLHATLLAAAGVEPRAEWRLEGVDLLPYLRGERQGPPHESLYWRFGPQMAIRSDDWKLVRYDLNVDQAAGPQRVTPPKLYNLADDIGEANDLAAQMPEKVKELQAKWDLWDRDNVKPSWGPIGPSGQNAGQGPRAGRPGAGAGRGARARAQRERAAEGAN